MVDSAPRDGSIPLAVILGGIGLGAIVVIPTLLTLLGTILDSVLGEIRQRRVSCPDARTPRSSYPRTAAAPGNTRTGA